MNQMGVFSGSEGSVDPNNEGQKDLEKGNGPISAGFGDFRTFRGRLREKESVWRENGRIVPQIWGHEIQELYGLRQFFCDYFEARQGLKCIARQDS
jgi:hypothetical protein